MWKSAITVALSVTAGLSCVALPAMSQFRTWGDGGTIIGRVFIDLNKDGEKQPEESGIPQAIIVMDDGLQVKTDEYGRFTIPDVYPGYRSGVLDLSSIPGYRIAANRYVLERNSQSRLVRVAPGSLARMNFGVVPNVVPTRPKKSVIKIATDFGR
jgi:hypothetical protein